MALQIYFSRQEELCQTVITMNFLPRRVHMDITIFIFLWAGSGNPEAIGPSIIRAKKVRSFGLCKYRTQRSKTQGSLGNNPLKVCTPAPASASHVFPTVSRRVVKTLATKVDVDWGRRQRGSAFGLT